MATIHDVAKHAGVSAATVSRSFSKSSALSAETRRRVLEAAADLNYRPRRGRVAADAASERKLVIDDPIAFQFFTLSVSSTAQNNAFYAPLLRGAQAEAASHGLHLLDYTMHRNERPQHLPAAIREGRIAGMLLVGTADFATIAPFCERIRSVVLVDHWCAGVERDSIVSDGFGGSYQGVKHLLDLGHRRIAFATSEPEVPTFRDRLHGYIAALFDAGISPDPDLVIVASGRQDYPEKVRQLLAGDVAPTAMAVANDVHAYLTMQVARSLNVRIPEDLSLVGFDDEQYSALACPSLTTLRVDTELMGRLAVRQLLTRLEEEKAGKLPDPHLTIKVPVSLTVRSSTGPPRDADSVHNGHAVVRQAIAQQAL